MTWDPGNRQNHLARRMGLQPSAMRKKPQMLASNAIATRFLKSKTYSKLHPMPYSTKCPIRYIGQGQGGIEGIGENLTNFPMARVQFCFGPGKLRVAKRLKHAEGEEC